MKSIQLDEVTWDALQYLSRRLGVDPSLIARDLLRPMIQYLRYYIVQSDIAEVCKDVIDIAVLDLPRVRKLDVDKKIIKDLVKGASILVLLKKHYKVLPKKLPLDEISKSIGLSVKNIRERLKTLIKLGFVEVDNGTITLKRAEEVIEKFIDCCVRLEQMYGLRTLKMLMK